MPAVLSTPSPLFAVIPCFRGQFLCSDSRNSLFRPDREFARNTLKWLRKSRHTPPDCGPRAQIPCYFPCSQGIPPARSRSARFALWRRRVSVR